MISILKKKLAIVLHSNDAMIKKEENKKNQSRKTMGYFRFPHKTFYIFFLYSICVFIIYIGFLIQDNLPVLVSFRHQFSSPAPPIIQSTDWLSEKFMYSLQNQQGKTDAL